MRDCVWDDVRLLMVGDCSLDDAHVESFVGRTCFGFTFRFNSFNCSQLETTLQRFAWDCRQRVSAGYVLNIQPVAGFNLLDVILLYTTVKQVAEEVYFKVFSSAFLELLA